MIEKIKNKRILSLVSVNTIISAVLFLPVIVFAQNNPVASLIQRILSILGRIVPVLIGLGLLIFIWGIILYVITDNDTDKKKARDYMMWGIIGLFVMTAVWGLIGLLLSTVFVGQNIDNPPANPTIEGVSGSGRPNTFQDVVSIFMGFLMQGVVPFILGLTVIVFLWGVFKYVSAGGSEVKTNEGVTMMTYGLIGLFVMFAVWGLVSLVAPFFGVSTVLPQF